MKGTMFASIQTLHDIGKTLEKIENILRRFSAPAVRVGRSRGFN